MEPAAERAGPLGAQAELARVPGALGAPVVQRAREPEEPRVAAFGARHELEASDVSVLEFARESRAADAPAAESAHGPGEAGAREVEAAHGPPEQPGGAPLVRVA